MKKWIYLAIGIILVVNAILSILFTPLPVNFLQFLWGVLGAFLLWKFAQALRKDKKIKALDK